MKKPLRIALAIALPGALLLIVLANLPFVLREIIMPTATAFWLVLRVFVLSIGQEIYWWVLIALAVFGVTAFLLYGAAARTASPSFLASLTWNPVRSWKQSILRNTRSSPAHDSFRRDLEWLLVSVYASSRPGEAKYQVRNALEERRIALPPGIYDFLIAATRSRARLPFYKNPLASAKAALASFSAGLVPARRRAAAYLRSSKEVIAFIETQLEITHEFDPEA